MGFVQVVNGQFLYPQFFFFSDLKISASTRSVFQSFSSRFHCPHVSGYTLSMRRQELFSKFRGLSTLKLANSTRITQGILRY